MVVFGFAFNPYDKAVFLFLARNGSSIAHVLIIDIKPNVDAAHQLWPRAALATTGSEAAAKSIREWLADSAT